VQGVDGSLVSGQVLLVIKGQSCAIGWSVLQAVSCLVHQNALERHLQPLLIAAFHSVANLLCDLGTLRGVVGVEGVVLKLVVARCGCWERKLQRTVQRLVEGGPFSVCRPASVVGVALALVVNAVFCSRLANPFGSECIPRQQQCCEQGEATHPKDLKGLGIQSSPRDFLIWTCRIQTCPQLYNEARGPRTPPYIPLHGSINVIGSISGVTQGLRNSLQLADVSMGSGSTPMAFGRLWRYTCCRKTRDRVWPDAEKENSGDIKV
jgi:hypothetical protein